MRTLILTILLSIAASASRAELTSDEQAFQKGLDAQAQTKYAETREYYHRAAAIVDKAAEPLTLGRKPKDYDARYLQPGEIATISKARDLSNIALMNGISISAPEPTGLPSAKGGLTDEEKSFAKTLGAAARKNYESTREYAHKASAIAGKTADPASFGPKPKAFDARYLKAGEAAIVSQAREMSNTALMKGIKIAP